MSNFSQKELDKLYAEKFGKTAKAAKKFEHNNSKYWIGNNYENVRSNNISDIERLAYLRSIANFVRIVAGTEEISVEFAGSQSYTDGKRVTIASNFKPEDFDVTVGLALHEASHIKYTDFSTLPKLASLSTLELFIVQNNIPVNRHYIADNFTFCRNTIKELLNIIEDRRIDALVFNSAAGYQGYYSALYNKYFCNEDIDSVLINNMVKQPTIKNYLFLINNLVNTNLNKDVLPGLRNIIDNMINVPNIGRVQNSTESLIIALNVFQAILNNVDLSKPQGFTPEKNPSKQTSKSEESAENNETEEIEGTSDEMTDGAGNNEETEKSENTEKSETEENEGTSEETEEDEKSEGNDSNTPEFEDAKLSAKEQKLLDKAMKNLDKIRNEQEAFTDGRVEKKELKGKDASRLNQLSKLNPKLSTEAIKEYSNYWDGDTARVSRKVTAMTVKGFRALENSVYTIATRKDGSTYLKENELYERFGFGIIQRDANKTAVESVTRGLNLGTVLGKKLQTRDEERTLVTSRLQQGRIDKRVLFSAEFNNNLFYTKSTQVSDLTEVILTLDTSGSMSGSKWFNTVETTMALAKAFSMTSTITCKVVIRTEFATNGGNQSGVLPTNWIIYNSKTDKIHTLATALPRISCNASTPEGLCYQSTFDSIADTSKKTYIISLTDGSPYTSAASDSKTNMTYSGPTAVNHIKEKLKVAEQLRINFLALFIGNTLGSDAKNFKTIYGEKGSVTTVNDLTKFAKLINGLFVRDLTVR
jgi:hypothetical protein